MKLEFLGFFFFERTQISNFMKIRPVGAEFHAGGRAVGTDGWMTKLIVALRNIANIVDPISYTSYDRESWGSTIPKFDMAFQICTIISVGICVTCCNDYGFGWY